MYAIVRAGGRQEKVAVGDVVVMDRVSGAPGSSVSLPVLLLVDGAAVTSEAAALANDALVLDEEDFDQAGVMADDRRSSEGIHAMGVRGRVK